MKVRSLLMLLAAPMACWILLYTENNRRTENSRRYDATPSPHFTGLGDLPGGDLFSTAQSVSADGAFVVGYSHTVDGTEAFRWTPTEGIVALGFAHASAISADGATIVGYRNTKNRIEPIRWTTRRGVERLEFNEFVGAASGVSGNGSTIVGVVESNELNVGKRDVAFRWTMEAGLKPLHDGTTSTRSEAHAVSADGAVVVGARRNPNGHDEAFRWTAESGLVRLGFLPGHTTSAAYAVSADGVVVVGCSSDYASKEAFRWTQETGMISLGSLSHRGRDSVAQGVSSDGSVVVGYSGGETGWEAFVWDGKRGMRSICQVLINEFRLASALRGWKLRAATAVSGDGSTVVGFGLNRDGNQEAWIARIAEAATTRFSN
jgi:probable HAF family extracellular repeat protein